MHKYIIKCVRRWWVLWKKEKSGLRKSGSLEGKSSDGGRVAMWKRMARVDFVKEVSVLWAKTWRSKRVHRHLKEESFRQKEQSSLAYFKDEQGGQCPWSREREELRKGGGKEARSDCIGLPRQCKGVCIGKMDNWSKVLSKSAVIQFSILMDLSRMHWN